VTANLLDLDLAGLERFFAERGEKPFRARQVSRGCTSGSPTTSPR
jgi:adenine C2-methylase RlmN of 23S rRNA A2503 and tRNA A37